MATEETIFEDSIKIAKNNILERLVGPCFQNGEVNIAQLKKELVQYKPKDIVTKTGVERSFAAYMRQLEHHVVMHLAVSLTDKDSDIDVLGEKIEKMNINDPLVGSAPIVNVDVVPRSNTSKDGKIVLTTIDQMKEAAQYKLIVVPDAQGRMVNANGNLVFTQSANNHWVCIGRKDGINTRLLMPEDVAFCKEKKIAYDATKVATIQQDSDSE